jgi:hypothetical protein
LRIPAEPYVEHQTNRHNFAKDGGENSQPCGKVEIRPLPSALQRNRLLPRAPAFFSRPLASSSGGVALLKNPHEVTAMKELNRNVPVSPLAYHLADRNDFCVCRVLEECALIKIESLDKLRAAKKFMRRIAAHVPGSYVIFSYRSKRVLGKVVSHATS